MLLHEASKQLLALQKRAVNKYPTFSVKIPMYQF